MKRLYFLFVAMCLVVASCNNSQTPLLEQLEAELAKRPEYKAAKEERIEKLWQDVRTPGISAERQMLLYEELYEQYATYQYDSAMSVVGKQRELAVSVGNREVLNRCDLHRIMLLATAGYFTEIQEMFDALPTKEFSPDLWQEYYKTGEWAYNRMADFLSDGQFSPRYYERGTAFQDSIMEALPKESLEYRYYAACRAWNSAETDSLIVEFGYIRDHCEPQQRLYAQAVFNMAWMYYRKGDTERQKECFILAAISDQKAQLKESLALQELALLLKEERGEDARANRYLSLAMEDAQFYGNRLRLLQIAHKTPTIMMDYERQLVDASKRQSIVIVAVGVLALLLVVALVAVAVMLKRLHAKSRLVEAARDDLKEAHEQTKTTNGQLHETNKLLREQSRLRESCISLFMELTAAYIHKLNAFQLNVQRKVKANQTADLLKLANPSRMSEQDARDFFMSFDKTFLSTFPRFVERVNALLREEERFVLQDTTVLNLDLRILALMRLGVRDTAKIATLLNCSQQTIYNHRSAIKSKAITKDTFDEQLMEV